VLVPVLDNEKHYWVGDDEVEKLLRHGAGWLAQHPEKETIAFRYLKYRRSLAREALARLVDEEVSDPDAAQEMRDDEEQAIERPINLNEQRVRTVVAALKSCKAKRVVDLGCGEGRLLRALLEDKSFEEVWGMDVSHQALERAQERLRLDRMASKMRERIRLIQGSLTYRDKRLASFDAATVIEVIEHLDEARLAAFERVLFEFARPPAVIVTTPNMEYNVRFQGLPAGKLRHKDHRFEWTRDEFQAWARHIAERFDYRVRHLPVGVEDPLVGAPTQMAIFTLGEVV
jgi:3' terminal RNA ribose 2'-O-methyltransferase Hen1